MPKMISYKKLNLKNLSSLPHIIVFCVGFLAGFEYYEFDKGNWLSAKTQTQELNVCFTPPAGCSTLIAREIHQAKDSIFMQAFSFTSNLIADEIIKAHRKG